MSQQVIFNMFSPSYVQLSGFKTLWKKFPQHHKPADPWWGRGTGNGVPSPLPHRAKVGRNVLLLLQLLRTRRRWKAVHCALQLLATHPVWFFAKSSLLLKVKTVSDCQGRTFWPPLVPYLSPKCGCLIQQASPAYHGVSKHWKRALISEVF